MMSQPSTQALDTSPEGVYRALLRCLKRTKGFGIVFVQCSPAEGTELIYRVQEDLSDKKIAVLKLTEPIDNLYDIVANRDDRNDLNILFIQGVEKSLEPYIKPGYGGDGDYYNLDTVPPILSHLNQRRENFRDRLSNICFVFILPLFAIKYIMRRAPDFFDWGSGVFDLSTDSSSKFISINMIEKIANDSFNECNFYVNNNMCGDNSQVVMTMPTKEYQENMIKLPRNELIGYYDEIKLKQYELWIKLGNLLQEISRYEEAIQRYDKAIKLKPDSCEAWNFRGIALLQLGRYEESIVSFDKALEIKPDYQVAKTNRDIALKELN
ncbi:MULTISPECIES: tetratricopeptide repeat protein [unclassified Microcoleus]|uniref:tetratricopeptide repeat protein n=1 Tax=unclassified Microcoleus TaxID=2642155 RepID=UPI002FCEC2B6